MLYRIILLTAFIVCTGCTTHDPAKEKVAGAAAPATLPAPRSARAAVSMPDTTPPGKPHFDSTGAQVGEQLPDLPVYTLAGERTYLSDAWRYQRGATLLLTSSYTCPKSRSTYPYAADLAKQLGIRVRIAVVYVIEAHPKGDPSPYSGVEDVTTENLRDHVLCAQPRTLEDRLKLAAMFQKRLEVKQDAIYVDSMDNGVWNSMGGGPNMGFLVDEHGIVLARQGWFDAKSMEIAVKAFFAAMPPKEKAPQKEERQKEDDFREIVQATERGDLETVRAQLARSPDSVKKTDPYSVRGQFGDKTLLHYAVERQHLDVAAFLISAHADVNRQTAHAPTPLHIAAKLGDVPMAKLLIQHGADVNAKAQGTGPTPLQEALIHRQPQLVDLLRASGAKASFFTDAASGNMDSLRARVDADATIASRPDGWGRPPLAYAAAGLQPETVKFLLDAGAHDFPHDRYFLADEHSAIWWAVHHKNVPMVRLLCENGSDPNLLADVIFDGSADIARELLAHKADAELEEHSGYRPLHEAAMRDRPEIAEMLIAAGAEVSPPTGIDRRPCGSRESQLVTPLHLAAEQGSDKVAVLLLKHGAKLEALDEDAKTPLHSAACSYQPPAKVAGVVKLLLAAGAKVNAKDADGKTPLDYALKASRTADVRDDSVVKLLREHAATEGAKTPGPAAVPPEQPRGGIGGAVRK